MCMGVCVCVCVCVCIFILKVVEGAVDGEDGDVVVPHKLQEKVQRLC